MFSPILPSGLALRGSPPPLAFLVGSRCSSAALAFAYVFPSKKASASFFSLFSFEPPFSLPPRKFLDFFPALMNSMPDLHSQFC